MNQRPPMRWFAWYDLWVVGYLVLAVLLGTWAGFRIDFRLFFDFKYDRFFAMGLFEFLVVYLLCVGFVLFFLKKDVAIFGPAWKQYVKTYFLTGQRLYDFVHVFVALKIVLSIHAIVKENIPLMHHAIIDRALLETDTFLHFGINPTQWVLTHLGSSSFLYAMDLLYIAWFQVKLPILLIFIITPKRSLYERFFYAFFSLWCIEGIFAVIFASWGPVYFKPEWFNGLHASMPKADALQQKLWLGYQQYLHNPSAYTFKSYEGVAAFPSLHVAVAAIFACFLYRLHPILGRSAAVYTAIIELGSVTLGWHYAIDGYFSIFLAYLLYRHSLRLIPEEKSTAAPPISTNN